MGLVTTFVCGPLAQLAEQRTLNPEVEGSTPSWPINNNFNKKCQSQRFEVGIFYIVFG